ATIAFGVAAIGEGPPARAVQALLSSSRERIVMVAAPFTPSAAAARTKSAWVPRVWLRQGSDGDATLGVDVVDGDVGAATQLLDVAFQPAPPTPLPPRGRGAQKLPFARTDLPDRAGHAAAVDDVLATIARGEASKIVLARRTRLEVAVRGDAVDDVLAGLLARESRGTAYLFVDGSDAFFGCSPERLCVRRGRTLEVDALAGTAPRGTTAADDDVLARRLLEDGKERREHAAVVEAITAVLAPLSAQLDVPSTPRLVRLGRVQHLHTPITATLVDDAPVFAALHPTPAIAGTPRDVAVAAIARLEPFPRGRYAGYVGVADVDGETLTVALRCAHAHDEVTGGVVDVFAGSGLVDGAVAEREWLELERKASLMLDVIADVVGDP
ncbi:MAG TPA: isochorismate synthase, partial [Myxococcota bacterium]